MLDWIAALPEVTAEVVRELVQIEAQRLSGADRIFWRWSDAEDEWVHTHPSEATALIRWLAERKSIESWSASDAVTHLEAALEAGARRADVLAAAEAVAALPSQAALPLIDRLRQPEDDSGLVPG